MMVSNLGSGFKLAFKTAVYYAINISRQGLALKLGSLNKVLIIISGYNKLITGHCFC